MQKVYLLTLLSVFFALPFASRAQATQQNFFNQIESAFPGADGAADLLLSGVNEVSGAPALGVQRIRPDGQISYHALFTRGIPIGLGLLPTADSGYLAAASFFQCDIPLNWMLFRFDANGNLLWEKEPGVETEPFDAITLLPGPGTTFWLFRDGLEPLQYSAYGELLESGPFALPVFRGFRATGSNTYLVYGAKGLALYAPNLLSYQFALQNTPLYGAVVLPGNRYAALSADSLYLLDAGLNILTTVAHGLPDNAEPSLAYAGGRLHLLDNTEPRQLIQFDTTSLQVLQTVGIPADAPFQPRFVLATQTDQVLLAGEEFSLFGAQVVAVRTAPADAVPDFDATADAALGSLLVPHLPVGTTSNNPSPAFKVHIDSVAVWLKNKGALPLQTATINSVLSSFSWFCGIEFTTYRQTFSNLNLLPGDSILLDIGPLDWSTPVFLPPQIFLCFWTTLPNDSLDADMSNNRTCQTFDVLVSTVCPGPVAERLTITPNPATSSVELLWRDSPLDPALIRLYNVAGQLVNSETTTGGHWTLHRNGLPAGLYTVQLQTGDGKLFVGRLVWR